MFYEKPQQNSQIHLEKSSEGFFMEGLAKGRNVVRVDEGNKEPPVGSGQGWYPSPVDYMILALTSCQVAVLTQCLAKANVDQFKVTADADIAGRSHGEIPGEMPEHTSSRIDEIDIDIELSVPPESEKLADRCLSVYDAGCIVGQSYRRGIDYTPYTQLRTDFDG